MNSVKLHDNLKNFFWILKLQFFDKTQLKETIGTCFTVDGDGLALSCAHLIPKQRIESIRARRLHENDFPYEVEVLFRKPQWDVCLLKIKGVKDCCFGPFALDGSLSIGETLLHMGNPGDFVGSLSVGRAAYPCVNEVKFPLDKTTCAKYRSMARNVTPTHRIMGNVWNEDFFEGPGAGVHTFAKQIHALVPIIQMCGVFAAEGCSGGPVLNMKGEIVGMVSMGFGVHDIAVHVSLLKHFLEESKTELGGDTMKRKDMPNLNSEGGSKKYKGV